MATGSTAAGGLFKSLGPRLRLQSTDVAGGGGGWGVAAATAALWLVQPFDWLKKQLFEKPEPEQ